MFRGSQERFRGGGTLNRSRGVSPCLSPPLQIEPHLRGAELGHAWRRNEKGETGDDVGLAVKRSDSGEGVKAGGAGGGVRGNTGPGDRGHWRNKKKTRMRPLGAHGLHSLNVGIVLAAPTHFLVIWAKYHLHWGRDGVYLPSSPLGEGRVHPFLPQGSFFLPLGPLFFCPRPLFFCLWDAPIYVKNCLF